MAEQEGQKPEADQTPDGVDNKLVASPEYAADLRKEAKEWRLKAQAMQKDLDALKGERERQTLEAKGNYDEALKKALADTAALGEKAQAAEKYQAIIDKMLETQRKDIPSNIATLLDRLDPADQLEWLAENAASIKPQPEPETTPKAGNASFNPVGTKATMTDRERIAALNKSRGVSSPFG